MGVGALPIVAETHGAASTDGKTVFYNPSFIAEVKGSGGEGAVRFILAHELGHAHNGMCGGHAGELLADEFAARSLAATGIDPEAIMGVAGHLNQSSTKTHPAASTRAAASKAAYERANRNIEPVKKQSRAAPRALDL